MDDPMSADQCFMRVAMTIAQRSKDPKTKVGAVLVSPDGREISVGWNGFPAGMTETPELWARPAKYQRVLHAELNAILNAKKDLTGWTLYTTLIPCVQCCLSIVQSRIGRVVFNTDFSMSVDLETSIGLLEKNGVSTHFLVLED